MSRARASRPSARAALVAILLLASAVPVSAASPNVSVLTTSSPTSVTVGHAIGYIVNVANDGGNTLNHVTLTGEIRTLGGDLTSAFTYLGAYTGASPTPQCSQTTAFCDFGQLGAGTPAPKVTFYYQAPTAPDSYNFFAIARVSEGGTDSGNASHVDTFPDPPAPILTQVLAVNKDLTRGHAIQDFRTFTTGLDNLDAQNPHGTKVRIPSANAEVTVKDLSPNDPANAAALACPTVIAATCFGAGSSLDVGDGGVIPGGIEVTMRWDVTELPRGMTEKKLRVAHLLAGGGFEQVKNACAFVAGVPINMPCFSVAPFRHADKDIEASFYLAFNRVSRGY